MALAVLAPLQPKHGDRRGDPKKQTLLPAPSIPVARPGWGLQIALGLLGHKACEAPASLEVSLLALSGASRKDCEAQGGKPLPDVTEVRAQAPGQSLLQWISAQLWCSGPLLFLPPLGRLLGGSACSWLSRKPNIQGGGSGGEGPVLAPAPSSLGALATWVSCPVLGT